MNGIIPPFLLSRIAHEAEERFPRAAVAARRTLAVDPGLRSARGRLRLTIDGDSLVATAGPERTISDAENREVLPGRTVRTEDSGPSGDASADEAFDGLGTTFDLFLEAFSRNGIDGEGGPLLATVHYGEAYDNAFWEGTRMVFGDGDGEVFRGFTGSLSVIAHELTHGVIEYTAGLRYRDQSGALNESIADVFGALAEQRSLGQSADEASWLIGAGIFTDSVAGVALRSMSAPGTAFDDPVLGRDPQPAHMSDFVVTTDDNGGVHINSGIPNRAFHIAATTLGGPAWQAPGTIWYRALTSGLSPAIDFAGFAAATVEAAVAEYGEQSREADAVRTGWTEVGVAHDETPRERGSGRD